MSEYTTEAAEGCGCITRVFFTEGADPTITMREIDYCPLHKAAPKLLKALEQLNAAASRIAVAIVQRALVEDKSQPSEAALAIYEADKELSAARKEAGAALKEAGE